MKPFLDADLVEFEEGVDHVADERRVGAIIGLRQGMRHQEKAFKKRLRERMVRDRKRGGIRSLPRILRQQHGPMRFQVGFLDTPQSPETAHITIDALNCQSFQDAQCIILLKRTRHRARGPNLHLVLLQRGPLGTQRATAHATT